MDIESWQRDLVERPRDVIARAPRRRCSKVTPDHDVKLQTLKRAHRATRSRNPINPGNRKVLIFSAFADTANYLYRELAPCAQRGRAATRRSSPGRRTRAKTTLGNGLRLPAGPDAVLAAVEGNATSSCRRRPREIDVLIGTDCISEGQNLQDCDYLVNYDIHWNPVRIIQRFGRIDRIGSTNAQIQLVNFWPDISLDEYINLKERVENRMVIADLAATADDNVLTQEVSDTAFRKEQLRKLQDEVIELEDVRTGVSITDLGLNDFRMDLLGYIKEYGDLAAAPKGLHAVVPAQPEQGPHARGDLRAAQRRRRRDHQPRQPPAPALPRLPRRRRQRDRRPHRGQAPARPHPRRMPRVRRTRRRGRTASSTQPPARAPTWARTPTCSPRRSAR